MIRKIQHTWCIYVSCIYASIVKSCWIITGSASILFFWILQILPQHRYMKHGVHTTHRLRQVQMISQCSNSSGNHIRPNVPRAKLSSSTKMNNTFCWRHIEKNLVTNWELRIPPSDICISLLTTSNGQQVLVDLSYLIMSLLYQIETNQRSLTNDIPNRVVKYTCDHFGTSPIIVIIRKLFLRKWSSQHCSRRGQKIESNLLTSV